jgi:antibiotic biosynthesis monooxygenase (ABM) superfamily enzyme
MTSAPCQTSAAARPPTGRGMPSLHRRALLTWLAACPAITLVQSVPGPYIGGWSLVARTAVITAVAVPLSVYVLVPRLLRLAAGGHQGLT